MPPAAIGTTPPTPHTRLTSTRAPRPHGTPQEQPAVRSEVDCSTSARYFSSSERSGVLHRRTRARRAGASPLDGRCGVTSMQGGGQGLAKRYEWQSEWFRKQVAGECQSLARAQPTYEAMSLLVTRRRLRSFFFVRRQISVVNTGKTTRQYYSTRNQE